MNEAAVSTRKLFSGINPLDLRGSKTGVFVGCSASETSATLTHVGFMPKHTVM